MTLKTTVRVGRTVEHSLNLKTKPKAPFFINLFKQNKVIRIRDPDLIQSMYNKDPQYQKNLFFHKSSDHLSKINIMTIYS